METQSEPGKWDALRNELQSEMDQYKRELKEIALMLEQSQLEVNKLAQRNLSITAHLQQVQTQFESLPRADIRMTYDSAIDAQQRLFVMRGQLEKLQNDQNHMNHHMATLEKMLQVMEGGQPKENRMRGGGDSALTVERIIQAQEAERQHLSRQMHDGPAQALSNFILLTEIAMRLFDIDQSKAREELENLKATATGTFQKVRDFIFDLRPMMLDDLGLTPTLKRYVEAFKEQTGLDLRLSVTGMERRMESYQEVMIFRAVQELLGNAARYSQASQVKVALDMGDNMVKLLVEDDGKGFDTDLLEERPSLGLKLIRERVEMMGGFMDVTSDAGQGTRVVFHIPASSVSVELS
jgi:two-component system sensor histidine kinase DegS